MAQRTQKRMLLRELLFVLVNAHEYGNGTSIFTRDGDAAREFASRIEVGMA